jgi:hypothetical protein
VTRACDGPLRDVVAMEWTITQALRHKHGGREREITLRDYILRLSCGHMTTYRPRRLGRDERTRVRCSECARSEPARTGEEGEER